MLCNNTLLASFLTALLTGISVFIAGLRTPMALAKRIAKKISKNLTLSSIPLLFESKDPNDNYVSRILDLEVVNGSTYSMHNAVAYLTVICQPDDLADSIKPRIIGVRNPSRPPIRQLLWWNIGDECLKSTDVRPGEAMSVMFLRSHERKSPYVVNNDNDKEMIRSITVGTSPEANDAEFPIVELKREHHYDCFVTIICDETKPICFKVDIDPQSSKPTIAVMNVDSSFVKKSENSLIGDWATIREKEALH